jgi:hypothetical protein
MKARQLIDGASFGPEALKVISQAFDTAWLEIAGNFGDDSGDIERARNKLAIALLSVASEDSRDEELLKQAALQRMALNYRRRDHLSP